MEAMLKRIQSAKKPLIIFTTRPHQERILRQMHENNFLKPVQFILKKDLFQKVFFQLKPHAVDMAAAYFKTEPAIIETQMAYLHKIKLNLSYNDKKLQHLQALKAYLIEHNLLIENRFKAIQFKNKALISYGDFFDPHYEQMLKLVQDDAAIEAISPPVQVKQITYTAHEDIESEVRDLVLKILTLSEKGVALDQIKLYETPNAYYKTLKRLFKRYNLPLNLHETLPMYAYPLVQTFLVQLQKHSGHVFSEALERTFVELETNHLHSQNQIIYERLLKLANPMIEGDYTFEQGFKGLKHKLKKHKAPKKKTLGAIEDATYEDLDPNHVDTVFILGMAQGLRPTLLPNHDFIDERLKETIDYPSNLSINKAEKLRYLKGLKAFKNLHFSYATKVEDKPYDKSPLIDDIGANYQKPHLAHAQVYSYLDDKLNVKMAFDQYQLYHQKSQMLSSLYPQFKNDIEIHDHTFKGLNAKTLESLLNNKTQIGVTRIEDFFKCQFRFLLSHFLKLDTIDETFYLDLGTLAHDILETKTQADQWDEAWVDERIEALIEKRQYPKKTQVFFKLLKPKLKEAFHQIKQQEATTNFAVHKREMSLDKNYQHKHLFTLKGKIDKTFKDSNDVVLIDYKTGQKALNLKTAYYGIGAQLLFYALLYKSNDQSDTILGLYEQTLLHKPFEYHDKKSPQNLAFEAHRLQGISLADKEKLNHFDPDVNKRFIQGFSITKNGDFAKPFKRYGTKDLNRITTHLESLLQTAFESIEKGDFRINPKRIDGQDVSCAHCPFKDICYQDETDVVKEKGFDFEELLGQLKSEVS